MGATGDATSLYGGYVVAVSQYSGQDYYLVVPPVGIGQTTTQWKTTDTVTPGATSTADGRINTEAMMLAGIDQHPAAKFCKSLAIGGFTDWYLPSSLELNVINSVQDNAIGLPDYQLPPWEAFSAGPYLTSVDGGTPTTALGYNFSTNSIISVPKTGSYLVRAVRRSLDIGPFRNN